MKFLTTITAIALMGGTLAAQGVITRMNNGASHFRYDGDIQAVLDDADQEAGVDTIILGGGTYLLTADLYVTSPVVMIGSGIHADSTLAYFGRTSIAGGGYMQVYVNENASGSEFHGIAFVDQVDVFLGTGNLATTNVDNVRFVRCEFSDLSLGDSGYGSQADNTYIDQCVISTLDISESTNPIIRNSVLGGLTYVLASSNCLVENCIFMDWSISANSVQGVQYNNNIFLRNSGTVLNITQQSTFQNNLFVGSGAGFNVTFGNGVTNSNNQVDYPLNGANGAFPSATVTSFNTFNYQWDYHVAAAWQTLGLGGTPVGLFGGAAPWKEGSLPFNPHWSVLNTPNSTSNGTLQGVQIKASAQQQ